jgi:hypothetical protein
MFDPNALTDEQWLNIYGFPRNPPAPKPFAKWEQPWNSMELASYAAGRALVAAINSTPLQFVDGARPIGGGVLPGDDEQADPNAAPAQVGLFVPSFAGISPRMEIGPDGTKYYELHMFFNNRAVVDVGLFLDELSRNALAQTNTLKQLAMRIEQAARRP